MLKGTKEEETGAALKKKKMVFSTLLPHQLKGGEMKTSPGSVLWFWDINCFMSADVFCW